MPIILRIYLFLYSYAKRNDIILNISMKLCEQTEESVSNAKLLNNILHINGVFFLRRSIYYTNRETEIVTEGFFHLDLHSPEIENYLSKYVTIIMFKHIPHVSLRRMELQSINLEIHQKRSNSIHHRQSSSNSRSSRIALSISHPSLNP